MKMFGFIKKVFLTEINNFIKCKSVERSAIERSSSEYNSIEMYFND